MNIDLSLRRTATEIPLCGTTTPSLAARAVTVMMLCGFFGAVAADAAPITATVTGCVMAQPGQAVWTSTEHFPFASYWDLEDSCEPTVSIPTQMYDRVDFSDGSVRITVTYEMLYQCGRGQFDAADMFDSSHSWLIVRTGVNCRDYVPSPLIPIPPAPVDQLPPPPSEDVPPTTSFVPPPVVQEPPATPPQGPGPSVPGPSVPGPSVPGPSVPEPAVLTMTMGIVAAYWWQRRR